MFRHMGTRTLLRTGGKSFSLRCVGRVEWGLWDDGEREALHGRHEGDVGGQIDEERYS
jgi:hypothetical protein